MNSDKNTSRLCDVCTSEGTDDALFQIRIACLKLCAFSLELKNREGFSYLGRDVLVNSSSDIQAGVYSRCTYLSLAELGDEETKVYKREESE